MVIFFILCLPIFSLMAGEKFYFATSADTEHYEWALNLIATIHRYNYSDTGEIAVFDLGLTDFETNELEKIEKVKVYPVEVVNKEMLIKFKVNKEGKIARGWYSWKPVVLKQALDLFPAVLYLDAGITLTGPSHPIFKWIQQHNCFLVDCGHNVKRMAIQSVSKKFQLNLPENSWVLDTLGISAGVQGVTSAIKESYILPLYQMAHDISYFVDDGSAPKGFGFARHDQTLFSIQARLLHLPIAEGVRQEKLTLAVNDKQESLNMKKLFKFSRDNFDFAQSKKFLQLKKKF